MHRPIFRGQPALANPPGPEGSQVSVFAHPLGAALELLLHQSRACRLAIGAEGDRFGAVILANLHDFARPGEEMTQLRLEVNPFLSAEICRGEAMANVEPKRIDAQA